MSDEEQGRLHAVVKVGYPESLDKHEIGRGSHGAWGEGGGQGQGN
jgi:hypothetical protein